MVTWTYYGPVTVQDSDSVTQTCLRYHLQFNSCGHDSKEQNVFNLFCLLESKFPSTNISYQIAN